MREYLARIRAQLGKAMSDGASADRIAWSFALGTFLAILPTPGLSVVIGLGLGLALKSIHTFSLVLAFLVWNPLVTAPLYALSVTIGNYLFADEPVLDLEVSIFVHIYRFTRRFLVGNLIIAITLSLLSFVIVRMVVQSRRRRKARPSSPKTGAT